VAGAASGGMGTGTARRREQATNRPRPCRTRRRRPLGQLRVLPAPPAGAWVDLEAAAAAVHEAESLLAAHDLPAAYGPTFVAFHITRRPFLPGGGGPWTEARRAGHQALRLRALSCVLSWNVAVGDRAAASAAGRTILELDPFSEPTYRSLMRAHADGGARAEALRVYEQCRRVLADELGVPPSPETEALYLELLRG
jgi:SARP family transcriptional regulator, regulator of embCAB operon